MVETHSDHILNGIRISVKHGETDPNGVAIHFFDRSDTRSGVVHSVTSPKIDLDGRLETWPPGFFDQWEQSLTDLL